jgi:hypothetical protein
MANPTCSLTTLVTNAAQYNQQFITPQMKRCLAIYAKVLELEAIGGTDYTGDGLVGALASDAASLFNSGFTPDALEAANLAILFANATAAGATVPADVNDKLAAINKLLQTDPNMLAKMDTLLNCKLGVHKNYPQ